MENKRPASTNLATASSKARMARMFIHIPAREEILADLAATGWRHEVDALRAEIANETEAVRAFGDDCRFWVAQNPT